MLHLYIMQINELDWFEFETRMRSIVAQIIQPLVKNTAENTSSLETILKRSDQQSKKIKLIENITGTPDSKTGWIKEVESSLDSLSLEFKLLSTNFSQEIYQIKEISKNSQTTVQEIKAKIESYDQQIEYLEKQIEKNEQTIQGINTNVYDYFKQTREDLEKKMNEINLMTSESNRLSEKSIKMFSELMQKTNDNSQTIDKIRTLMREQSMQIIQLFHEKSNLEDYMKFTGTVDSKLDNFNEKIRQEDNKMQEIIRYIDVYLPFDIQVYVSDNMYSVLKRRALKTWMKFENQRRKELQGRLTNFESSIDIGEIMKRTQQSVRLFENRKDDVYYKMIRRKAEQEMGTSSEEEQESQRRKLASLTMKAEKVPDISLILDQEVMNQVNDVRKEFTQVHHKVDLLEKHQDSTKKSISSIHQELSISIQVLEENLKSSKKEDNETHANEISNILEKLDSYRHKLQNCYEAIVNLSGLVSSLVEFSIVTNAILDQEEKDKKDIHKQSSELTLPQLTTRKNSMAPSEFLSGKALIMKPQASYNSTPLRYKNVLYSREEIIELIGKVITRAWTEASSKPPFLPKVSHRKSASKNLNSTLNLSSSFLKP